MRIRSWKRDGVLLLTPAHKWVHGRFAQAYHRFIQLPEMVRLMRNRRTSVEPLFDLIAKVIDRSSIASPGPTTTVPSGLTGTQPPPSTSPITSAAHQTCPRRRW